MFGRDPIWLLVPVIASGAIADYWPGFERFMNAAVNAVAVMAAIWVVVHVGWLWLGPLPRNVKIVRRDDADEPPEATPLAAVPDV